MQKSFLVARTILFWCAGSASAGPCYDLEYIYGPTCPIFGPTAVSPEDIATDGTIVGYYKSCADTDQDDAFVWKSGQPLFTIPRMPGVWAQFAHAINARGLVAMQVHIPAFPVDPMAWVYDLNTGFFTPAAFPKGATYTIPRGIGVDGTVVGEWTHVTAFIAQGGRAIDLGPLFTHPRSQAWAVNSQMQVAGWHFDSGGGITVGTAFLWHKGALTELGPVPGGSTSEARSINETGQIAVFGQIPNPAGAGTVTRAFLWDAGRWTPLGLLKGFDRCGATDLNDLVQIIGTCGPGTGTTGDYVWQSGLMYDLDSRIVNSNGVTLRSVRAINNSGEIAALGRIQHPFHGPSDVVVRLVPRPPQPADLNDDCHVSGPDLMALLRSWGPVATRRDANSAADLNHDAVVNGIDLGMLLAAWTS